MSIHPQIIEKEGKKEFVVLPYEEFVAIKEALEDYEDLKDLRDAKVDAKVDTLEETTVPLSDVRTEILDT